MRISFDGYDGGVCIRVVIRMFARLWVFVIFSL